MTRTDGVTRTERGLPRRASALAPILVVVVVAVALAGAAADVALGTWIDSRILGELGLARARLVARTIERDVAADGDLSLAVAGAGAFDRAVTLVTVAAGHPARIVACTRADWTGCSLDAMPDAVARSGLVAALRGDARAEHVARHAASFDLAAQIRLPGGAIAVRLDTAELRAGWARDISAAVSVLFGSLVLAAAIGFEWMRRRLARRDAATASDSARVAPPLQPEEADPTPSRPASEIARGIDRSEASERVENERYAPPPTTTVTMTAAVPVASPDSDRQILIVDDNSVNQRLALALVAKLGLRGDAVGNGAEALAALEHAPYSAVLMDCQMPVMDGFEATAAIRRLAEPLRRTPIIAMTANALEGDRERCLAAGMDDYLSKPVQIEKLRDALARFLGCSKGDAAGGNGATGGVAAAGAAAVDCEYIECLRRDLSQEGDESDPVTELIDLFLGTAREKCLDLRAALSRGDGRTLEFAAHALKGSSSSLGAFALAKLCEKLQAAAHRGEISAAAPLVSDVDREMTRVRAALESMRVG